MTERVVVVGGGPSGATCARQLARLGHEVGLAEQISAGRPRLGETCGPGLRRALGHGCGLSLPGHVQRPLTGIRSAWGDGTLERRFLPFWNAEPGMVLDRPSFDRWLIDAAAEAGVGVLRGCRVLAGARSDSGWQLQALVDGRERRLDAGFVVEATGRAGRSVTQPELPRLMADELVCLSAELPGSADADGDALVEAGRAGWWYSALLPGGGRVLALFTDADLVGRAPVRGAWFADLLAETTHIRRVAPVVPGHVPLRVCAARTSVRRVLWRGGCIAIGDAGYFLDPLSGTGIERAVTDGIDVAEPISQALRSGELAPLREFAVRKANSFLQSLLEKRRYYGAVARWADEPFWARRRLAEHDWSDRQPDPDTWQTDVRNQLLRTPFR